VPTDPGNDHAGRPAATTSPLLVHAALLTVSLLFGSNYVVAKVAFREVSPLVLVVIRTWGTAILLFGAAALMPRKSAMPKLRPQEFRELFLYSILGVSFNQLCFLEGLSRSTATNASIILVAIPLLTLAVAVALRRERASVTGVAGIAIGLTGALLLIVPRGGVTLSASALTGNMLLLAGSVSYSFYLVLTRGILARHDPVRVVRWIFLLAALTVLPFGFGGLRQLMVTGLSPAGWASVVFVTVGATVLPYLLNTWALARVKASVVAVYILVQPIVAGAMGRIFLGEHLGPNAVIAGALVMAGVVLSVWKPSQG
jgi:drug/metabolite transporter (DMT)-like permease